MLSITSSYRPVHTIAVLFSCALGATVLAATPAQAQSSSFLGIPPGGARIVCVLGSGTITVVNSDDSCNFDDPADSDIVTGIDTGNATFNDVTNRTDIAGGTLLVNGVTTTFSGGTTGFSSPVTFSGSSVTINSNSTFGNASTFNALADFNNGITSNTITNSGTINTATVSAGSVVSTTVSASGSLLVGTGGYVDMGGNVVHFVAAGVANTDAVNVGQLTAATSGITTDVTALETLTATHTTQIATHTTQIGALETLTTTHSSQITALEAADMAFDSRIDTLELLAVDFDERIDVIDDRASAGTAAAVALSGAMFLPGKSFNLTGNVGAYRGAVAGALQLGALVDESIAVNAGVAHGFNKGGKTAVRAGLTIGW